MPSHKPVPRFRLLLIEDDEGREQQLRAWLPDDILMSWAQSAGTAMGVIRRDTGHVWSGVMLDHDLEQRARTEDDLRLSGTDVALAIMEHFSIDIPILVHSANQAQAPRVVRQLEQKGFWVKHIPYYHMTEQKLAAWVEEAQAIWSDLKGG